MVSERRLLELSLRLARFEHNVYQWSRSVKRLFSILF